MTNACRRRLREQGAFVRRGRVEEVFEDVLAEGGIQAKPGGGARRGVGVRRSLARAEASVGSVLPSRRGIVLWWGAREGTRNGGALRNEGSAS